MKKISIIIPTFNELKNVIPLIVEIKKDVGKNNVIEIIVVDDDSPDKTGEMTKKHFLKEKNVRVFIRKKERGLASAILYGIKRAKGEIIVSMDADFNHPPEKISDLIQGLKTNDFVVGSRFIEKGGMDDKKRYYLTFFYNFLLKHLLSFPIMDNMSGFYAIRKDDLYKMPLEKIYRGYGEYHLRLVYYAKKKGLRIKELPVYYKERKYGSSKSNLKKLVFIYTKTALKQRFSNEI